MKLRAAFRVSRRSSFAVENTEIEEKWAPDTENMASLAALSVEYIGSAVVD